MPGSVYISEPYQNSWEMMHGPPQAISQLNSRESAPYIPNVCVSSNNKELKITFSLLPLGDDQPANCHQTTHKRKPRWLLWKKKKDLRIK